MSTSFSREIVYYFGQMTILTPAYAIIMSSGIRSSFWAYGMNTINRINHDVIIH